MRDAERLPRKHLRDAQPSTQADSSDGKGRPLSVAASALLALRLLRPHARLLCFIILVNCATAAVVGVAEPLVQKHLFDSLTEYRIRAFCLAAALLVTLGTALRLLSYVSALVRQRLKNEVTARLTLDTFDTYYDLAYSQVSTREPGYFISRVHDEPSRAVGLLIDTMTGLSAAVITFVGAVSVAIWLSWKIAVILTVVVPILLYLSRRFHRRIVDESRRSDEEQAALKDGLGRAIDAYRDVNIFALQNIVRSRIQRLLETYQGTVYRRLQFSARFRTSSNIFLSYAELAVLIGAGIQVLRRELSIGGLFAFMGAYWRVVGAVNSIIGEIPTLAQLQANLSRLHEFKNLPRARRAGSGHVCLELTNVSVAYDSRIVLDDLTLRVPRGRKVLVTGPNGSGKSTLAHVLVGLISPTRGIAMIPSLERLSSLLLPPRFIPGSLKDNVGFDSMTRDHRQRLMDLSDAFGLRDKLDQDPATLSQGEQRKAQLVMALLKKADFYVFDEPLSNIDVDSKARVMECIFNATADCGLVVIMHGDAHFRDWFDEEIRLTDSPGVRQLADQVGFSVHASASA